ncbi:hypothetical protein C3489_03005 [Streptomyces sp. Ru71]|uniref:effector-associated constant component EACC1 n=1 Tax=Streptomyces sp. Ru71 TaxID=2080746 RepID=UPI000CDD6B93|nr:hypothetical protein [Streptomyces sp. Ru71]POX56911.1 hypothetical protein C3489_03005 [Streptomyces sp. Ru71]
MAEGDAEAGAGVRVALDASASRADVGALQAWLEQEQPIQELVRAGALRIEVRPGDGADEHMGSAWEIALHIVGEVTTVATLAEYTSRAVKAWKANRRRVENGEPPRTRVDPLDPGED